MERGHVIITSEPKHYVLKGAIDVYGGYDNESRQCIVEYDMELNKDNEIIRYPKEHTSLFMSFPFFFKEIDNIKDKIEASRKYVNESRLRAAMYDKFKDKELKAEDLLSTNTTVAVFLDYTQRVFIQFSMRGSWQDALTLKKAQDNLVLSYAEYDSLLARGHQSSTLNSYEKDANSEANWLRIYEYMIEHKLEIIKEAIT